VKRKIASRKLKKTCANCNCSFTKGNVYYVKRKVFVIGGTFNKSELFAYEVVICPKCKYKSKRHVERFESFKGKCHHPIVEEVWSTIPGEIIMQPDHDECVICGKWL